MPDCRLLHPGSALVLLFLGTLVALAVRAGPSHPATLEVALLASLVLGTLAWLGRRSGERTEKLRLVAMYFAVLGFYAAVARIVPALHVPLQDQCLLHCDRLLLGETPAVWCQPYVTPVLTDLLSLCYLSYHVYLHLALMHALLLPAAFSRRLATGLAPTFALGMTGYLLVPALGPGAAFPELFDGPLAGTWPTGLTARVVAWGSSVYDVFPSLHVAITCVLLQYDWALVRRRFWIMLGPALGLLLSTVYLRYHYVVDLLAGFGLFLAVRGVTVWSHSLGSTGSVTCDGLVGERNTRCRAGR